ncbi:MAG: BON domain-containing protein [Firmicutes bacterium]|nr:BON domain-containing protein [Bacillota bacterium]
MVKRKVNVNDTDRDTTRDGGENRDRDRATRAVQAAIEADEGMRPYGIKVEARGDDKVRIWGVVDTLSEKNRAGDIARSIPGISEVENDLAISTDGEISDSEVAFEAREELAAEPGVDLRGVGVQSGGGTVILKGEVESEGEREAAMRAVSKARGARMVVSQLKDKGTGPNRGNNGA